MKEKIKGFLNHLFRVDVFNRIIVFLSMTLFLVWPSYILYYITDYTSNNAVVLPCVILIAEIIGNGLMTLYRPVRLSWFYFFETLFLLCLYSNKFIYIDAFDTTGINTVAIYVIEVVYCSLGCLLNIAFFINYLRKKRRYASEFKEDTNADSYYDFLNGAETNKKIESHIENIPGEKESSFMKWAKKVKLSRMSRILTFIAYGIMAIIYLAKVGSTSVINNTPIYFTLVSGLIILPIALVSSIMFPRDFKYIFYFNCALFEVATLFLANSSNVPPIICILALTVLGISLLITTITEGRSWTGAPTD